jgi:hypothetical protein
MPVWSRNTERVDWSKVGEPFLVRFEGNRSAQRRQINSRSTAAIGLITTSQYTLRLGYNPFTYTRSDKNFLVEL